MKSISCQPGAQTKFLASSADFAIYGGSAGSGKALDINTLIPTERGFLRMGEIKAGDRVFAIDGTLSTVLHAFEISLHEDAYEVEFDSGEVFVVDGDHLWKTMTDKERVASFHRTEEFRERRRANRPSRAKEVKKNYGSSISVTQLNKQREYEYLEAPDGQVRTTAEILETITIRNDRANHSVSIAKPIELQHNEFIIDPYLFGMWLGDGCSHFGLIGCSEEDMNIMLTHVKSGRVVSEKVESAPIHKTPYKIVRFEGMASYLKKHNLYKNKHIPIEYLRSSKEQRIELLRGLMDTDGTCSKQGNCKIALSDEVLIKDVQELLCSLGIKCSITARPTKCKTSYGINFSADFYVFNLPRKRERQRLRSVHSERRYIKAIRKTEPCFMRCITIDHPSHLYLVGRTFVPTHNSFALLLEAARYINNPGFGAVIFRREMKMITSEGGLRDTAMEIYPHLGGVYRSQPTPQFIFPSGAKISFAHLNQETEVLSWQGSQIPFIGYDELTHYTKFQWTYMMSRMRSTCGVAPYCRATTNPDSDSWVAELLSWWIDQETGFPIPERSGVLRYFIRANDEMVWGDSREELMERYGCERNDPKSLTFVSAKITDNPILLKKDPGYLGNLKALSKVERARLLEGNWRVRAQAGDYFPRDAATIIDWIPNDIVKWIRSWDLAASEEGEGRDPDWTVGLLIGRRENGKIVVGDMIRVRRKADVIQNLIKTMAHKDGKDVWIQLPQDPGAAGKAEKESYQRLLTGFTVLSRTLNKNKVINASSGADSPAALWQRGVIEIVRANWNKELLDELDAFPTKGIHDDICFVAGTLIATEYGSLPIEKVVVGMKVWTRNGWHSVISSGATNENTEVVTVNFSNGISLIGTPNHPIIMENNQIVLLKNISFSDKIVPIDDQLYTVSLWLLNMLRKAESIIALAKWLNTMVCDFIAIRTQRIVPIEITLHQVFKRNKMELIYCTDKYGKTTSEKYQKDSIFTTKTKTRLTTIYQISNALLRKSIFTSILKGLHNLHRSNKWSILSLFERKPRNGIEAQKVVHGMSNMQRTLISASTNWLMLSVRFVERIFKRSAKQNEITVQKNAISQDLENNGIQEKSLFTRLIANIAAKNSSLIEKQQDFVQGLAQRQHQITFVSKKNDLEFKQVYNLRVEGSHEYYANGILVHNCDALSNGVRALPGHARPDYSQTGLSGRFKPIVAKPRKR